MIYSRTEASNRDGENDVVEPVERRERERERERDRLLPPALHLKSSVSVLSQIR